MRPALRSSTEGVELATVPVAESFFTTRNARTAGTGQLPAISTSICTRRVDPRPSARAGSGRGSGAGGIGTASAGRPGSGLSRLSRGSGRGPSRRRRVASASRSSMPASGCGLSPRAADWTISWRTSPAASRRSIAGASRRAGSFRKTSTRSSTRWASALIASSSMDALIPFTLWAWRKQESIASRAPAPPPWRAASSRRTRSFANAARCSPASPTKRFRYLWRSSATQLPGRAP